MGSSLGFIATIIGLGAIFGAMIEHSGGAQSLANGTLKFFGEKRATWAMLVTGFLISIPVFLDVALVILAPILYALARKPVVSVTKFGHAAVGWYGGDAFLCAPHPGADLGCL
jgi:Gnt-I system low-affinity gluconate transporter